MNNELNDLLASTTVDDGLIADQLLNAIEGATETIVEIGADDLADLEPATVTASEEDKDLGIDRSALYADQGDTLTVASDEEAAAIESTVVQLGEPDKKGSKRKSAATPGASTDPTTRSGSLKKKADITGLVSLGYTEAEVDGIMETIDAAPKKVGEKASNMVRYALGREHVANVTKFTLGKLRDNPAGFTTIDLVAMLQAERGYSVGTARSQAQQMSRLFQLFDMVGKDGKTLTLHGDNFLTKAVLARLAGDPFITATVDEPEEETVEVADTTVTAIAPVLSNRAAKKAATRANRGKATTEALAA